MLPLKGISQATPLSGAGGIRSSIEGVRARTFSRKNEPRKNWTEHKKYSPFLGSKNRQMENETITNNVLCATEKEGIREKKLDEKTQEQGS